MKAATAEQKRRYRSIRKAVATRRANRSWREQWEKVDKPALENYVALWNRFLISVPVLVELTDQARKSGIRLRGGVARGELLRVEHWGRTVLVRPTGYARAHSYSFAFWKPILPVVKTA